MILLNVRFSIQISIVFFLLIKKKKTKQNRKITKKTNKRIRTLKKKKKEKIPREKDTTNNRVKFHRIDSIIFKGKYRIGIESL